MSTAAAPRMIADVFHTLVVQPTTLCNLDCGYCYLPDRRRQRLMSADVAAALAASVAEQDSTYPVEVVWHGGEPIATPIGHLRSLLAEFEPLRRSGRIRHGVQTNATLLSSAWCDLLVEYGFHIGVSVDGPAACNAARVDRAGRPAFDRIMRGIRLLQEHSVPFEVICVVTADTIDRADELVEFFTEVGCASVGFNIEEQEGLNAHRPQVTAARAEAFWLRLWQLREAGHALRIRELDRLRDHVSAMRGGVAPASLPYDPIPTVAHDGDTVILSPELLGIRSAAYGDFLIGNVLRESLPTMIGKARTLRQVAEFESALRSCAATCEFWQFCGGAQAGNRFFELGTFDATETAYCRNSKQALVRSALTHLTTTKGTPA